VYLLIQKRAVLRYIRRLLADYVRYFNINSKKSQEERAKKLATENAESAESKSNLRKLLDADFAD